MKLIIVLVWIGGPTNLNAISVDFAKKMARTRLEKAGLPDPVCRTGIISAPIDKKQACCPSYCKECNDYKTCENVRGQDSKNACCASSVLKMQCGKGTPANVCLKKCTESLPPCIMDDGQVYKLKPPKVNAADDCNEAISDWRKHGEAAIKAGVEIGETQNAKITLKAMEDTVKMYSGLIDEAEDSIKAAEKLTADADDALAKAKDVEATIDKEVTKAEKLIDYKAKTDLLKWKAELKNVSAKAKPAVKDVKDATSKLESAKTDLDNKLKAIKGHTETATATDIKYVLDKASTIETADTLAAKTREFERDVNAHSGSLKDLIDTVKKDSERVKEEAAALATTTTTTSPPPQSCDCFHCGGEDPFNNADVCGGQTDECGIGSAHNGGCWTYADKACICSKHITVQPCECFYCGDINPFPIPDADFCGSASSACGPDSAQNSGCWNNVPDAACQCDIKTTTG